MRERRQVFRKVLSGVKFQDFLYIGGNLADGLDSIKSSLYIVKESIMNVRGG